VFAPILKMPTHGLTETGTADDLLEKPTNPILRCELPAVCDGIAFHGLAGGVSFANHFRCKFGSFERLTDPLPRHRIVVPSGIADQKEPVPRDPLRSAGQRSHHPQSVQRASVPQLDPHLRVGVEEFAKDPFPCPVKRQIPLIHHDADIDFPPSLRVQDAIPRPPQIHLSQIAEVLSHLKAPDQGDLPMGRMPGEKVEAAGHRRVPTVGPDGDGGTEGLWLTLGIGDHPCNPRTLPNQIHHPTSLVALDPGPAGRLKEEGVEHISGKRIPVWRNPVTRIRPHEDRPLGSLDPHPPDRLGTFRLQQGKDPEALQERNTPRIEVITARLLPREVTLLQ
jgi:hypothetical protein